jgi:ATP-dependent RNA helicase DeaD
VLKEVGYESPSPIQAATIPYLLDGHDVLGQAQTGTGKTAAFALPMVAKIDGKQKKPQALVLAPTRELAIQVAEACQKYASKLKGFHVLPVYGGQGYESQIRGLKRGAHVVVGTPGRVMDHMRKGTLDLSELKTLVLDEADEMLRMGFIDDVEWILEKTPSERQIALFSATMPKEVKRIATSHLNNPKEVTIEVKTQTASTIRQRVLKVAHHHKLDALTRILEVEPFDGMIIFTKTKNATEELSEKLQARGYAAAALNGDMVQKVRERTVDAIKKGRIDIIIATDVAARGLDVERMSHVVNYDIPYDTEAYVHRIGRTGRAGRTGDAILFATNREKRMLQQIEKATNQSIETMHLPTASQVNDIRVERFKSRITEAISQETEHEFFADLIRQYQQEHKVDAVDIAAALACLFQGDEPLLVEDKPIPTDNARRDRDRDGRDKGQRREKRSRDEDMDLETFRVEVGRKHKVLPKHVVGAIANEAGMDSKYIGAIEIQDRYTLVDLPKGMPAEVFEHLQSARIIGHPMKLSRFKKGKGKGKEGDNRPARSGSKDKPKKRKSDKKKQDK